LTFNQSRAALEVAWTADSRNIVYEMSQAEGGALMSVHADGSGEPQRLLTAPNYPRPQSISPDGRTLLYSTAPGGIPDLWTVSLDIRDPERIVAGKPEAFLTTPFVDVDGAFSPDGKWIAYVSNESGAEDVFVRPFPAGSNGGGKFRISTEGGKFPLWSRKERRLFYLGQDNRIWSVTYSTSGQSFEAAKPTPWSSQPLQRVSTTRCLDLHPDGKRLIVIPRPAENSEPQAAVHITVLLNFFDELKRRLP
jgi:Tol biopolymer transport system component